MLVLDETVLKTVRDKYPDRQIIPHVEALIPDVDRYIQIPTALPGASIDDIHYEVYQGKIELHFEGQFAQKAEITSLIDFLKDKIGEDEYKWEDPWQPWGEKWCRCQWTKELTSEDCVKDVEAFIDKFDERIREYLKQRELGEEDCLSHSVPSEKKESQVSLYTCNLEQVLKLPLRIPDYQRIYCWEEQNVIRLFEDVINFINGNTGKKYRLGTVILHYHDEKYDIIDGQQRLITLALWLHELGKTAGLLKEKLCSEQSRQYVAYNKYLIQELHKRKTQNSKEKETHILEHIEFSVLVLERSSIDLAYTFFSNQNSRGVALTDYDLLKAHHLRYIPMSFEQQATNAAETWNKMIEDGRSEREQYEVSAYEMALDTYIYRLRRWMRKRDCQDEKVRYRIKQEYEATPIIEGIPPFGERFYFNEPIQGGTHFFEYVKQHLAKFRRFTQTAEYLAIHPLMTGRSSCSYYRDVIEGILFAYYLKFEENYLADALAVIMRIILQHRYDNDSAQKKSVIRYACDMELALMIDQATSPTFFLAEARNIAKNMFININRPIKIFMSNRATEIMERIEKSITIQSFKELNK